MNPAPHLVLVGPMGAGKTSIGRRLASRLHANLSRLRALLKAPPEYAHRVDQAGAFTDHVERLWLHNDSS